VISESFYQKKKKHTQDKNFGQSCLARRENEKASMHASEDQRTAQTLKGKKV